jgi:WD40 repeat protein
MRLPMPRGHNYGDVPLLFAAGGTLLISWSADRMNTKIYFWDPATGKELHHIEQPVSRLVLSPTGKTLATTSWDKRGLLFSLGPGWEGGRHARVWLPISASSFAIDHASP